MDKIIATDEKYLLDTALAKLADKGLTAEIESMDENRQPDTKVRIGYGRRKLRYAVEIKQGLRPATLGAVLLQLERLGERALLVADYITPPLADTLKARGVAFIDAAGNAYLDEPPLLIWVKGEKPTLAPGAADNAGRAFQISGLKVLFVLLYNPEIANRPYRDIAQQAGVAHGTVGWVMNELSTLGFLAKVGSKRRLVQIARLFQQWTEAYARTLRPKLMLGRFRTENLEWWEQIDPLQYDLVLGGEAAAARLTKYLRPGTLTFYGRKLEPRLMRDQRLRADATGNVEFLKKFWFFEHDSPQLTPPILTYADLLATGDARCIETARLLEETIFARFDR